MGLPVDHDGAEMSSLISSEALERGQHQQRRKRSHSPSKEKRNSNRCAKSSRPCLLVILAICVVAFASNFVEIKFKTSIKANNTSADEKEENPQPALVVSDTTAKDAPSPTKENVEDAAKHTAAEQQPAPKQDEATTPQKAQPDGDNKGATVEAPKESTPAANVETAAQPTAGTTIPAQEPGYKKPNRYFSEVYIPRGQPKTDEEKNALAEKWGSWTFSDPKAAQRPKDIPFENYLNRDIPRADFPENAWQTDKDYLAEFLTQAVNLTNRAIEGILAEYGHSHFDEPNLSFEQRSHMFNLTILNLTAGETYKKYFNGRMPPGNGGFTTHSTLEAIGRRILHSIMTEDTFTFVMGGHSSAAGHGNHYQQSFTFQAGRVLEPVFARLGVYFRAQNFGMGGLGTIQNALAAGSIYGPEIDFLLWDSGMTEGDAKSKDLFVRQGWLGGNRVPVLWGAAENYEEKGVTGSGWGNTVFWGAGLAGLPITVNETQVQTLPWATRYLNCGKEQWQYCRQHAYNGTCWIERGDGFEPPTKQLAVPGGRAKWHPGDRYHQQQGRDTAFAILIAMRDALTMWMETDDYALPDEAWHVTAEYDRIRSQVRALTDTPCFNLSVPDGFCNFPIKGRTEFTPRNNPGQTSIRSIMKSGGYIPVPQKNVYDPPDVHNPRFDVPDGEIDLLAILENGNTFLPMSGKKKSVQSLREELSSGGSAGRSESTNIVAGQGWHVDTKSAADNCDGTQDSFCGRSKDNNCLLYAHNDYRGALRFDGLSGWSVMELEGLEHGIIVAKMDDADENPRTAGWKCENNADDCESADVQEKSCQDFLFEFAINGKITAWNSTELSEKRNQLQRVVATWTLLDDPNFTQGKTMEVELAIRMTGNCGRKKAFQLSHVYWA